MANVVDLVCYPVKGCAGTSMGEALLTPAGLAHDRTFMVTDENGVYRTQRRHPRLALIKPSVSAGGTALSLAANGTGVEIDVITSGPRRAVDLFGDAFTGVDQGDAAAAWLSEVLGTPSRLVRVPPEHGRIADGWTPGPSGYADSSAVHLLSRASLALLDRRMAEHGAPALPMSRFRPNIVVDGADWAAEPHAEDRMRRVRIGGTELGYAKLAVRCAVTLVDQEAGARAGKEPLRTLAMYRRAASGGVVFGTKFSVVRPGKLSVGDEVVVDQWGESER
ncbi:molybdenum cofactor sulfurase [Streptomyces sp. NBRC 14336]|uniref:MOSC domain-containing protein n=1 Tax=Streptomyces sp. NBRC 14336 TaxID=3030992 RepID=UPI0024A045ED|nr:MOSC N-terminal beta barrel domain-containing protein [Streptomyces sp. NBRC 14336]WBO76166.1 MOSC N-terminal beta barrel domain-containing protein [Streptomyces sp. SBE_14.2]GLW46758.1 molybdenum cofactor sulfurase [Streptomyces sp. NBRC 14336]